MYPAADSYCHSPYHYKAQPPPYVPYDPLTQLNLETTLGSGQESKSCTFCRGPSAVSRLNEQVGELINCLNHQWQWQSQEISQLYARLNQVAETWPASPSTTESACQNEVNRLNATLAQLNQHRTTLQFRLMTDKRKNTINCKVKKTARLKIHYLKISLGQKESLIQSLSTQTQKQNAIITQQQTEITQFKHQCEQQDKIVKQAKTLFKKLRAKSLPELQKEETYQRLRIRESALYTQGLLILHYQILPSGATNQIILMHKNQETLMSMINIGSEFRLTDQELIDLFIQSHADIPTFRQTLAKTYWEKIMTTLWDAAQKGQTRTSWTNAVNALSDLVNKLYPRCHPWIEEIMSAFFCDPTTKDTPPNPRDIFTHHPALIRALLKFHDPIEIHNDLKTNNINVRNSIILFIYIGKEHVASAYSMSHLLKKSLSSPNPECLTLLIDTSINDPQKLTSLRNLLQEYPERKTQIEHLLTQRISEKRAITV